MPALCPLAGAVENWPHAANLPQNEDEINLYCLRRAYPQISGIAKDAHGDSWLEFANGGRALYAARDKQGNANLDVDVRRSMAQAYPLEPHRPDTEWGIAPGRQRSFALLEKVYGDNPAVVRRGLQTVKLNGRPLSLSANAAQALERVVPQLEAYIAANPRNRDLLKVDGGYCWRKIAGENVLSAHSFGIALDVGANRAPYWRWSKKMPHPMQKTYPREIVEIMEKAGFIWGGKWHEYDLMHFEYRPELICKARVKAGLPMD